MEFDQIINKEEERIENNNDFQVEQETDQRTEEWFKQRTGRFTGSEIYKLMSCSRSGSKMEWGRPEKLVDFGKTAVKYIFSKAMERKRDKIIRSLGGITTRYGQENEDVVIDMFLKDHPNFKFEKVGFIEFLENIAGASPDGSLIINTSEKYGLEVKCPVSWDSFFERIQKIDETHKDFWQVQSEMLALKVDKLFYVVAEPSENILEPDIRNYDYQIVKASKVHQQELIKRCKIGQEVIFSYLINSDIYKSLRDVINNLDYVFRKKEELEIQEQYKCNSCGCNFYGKPYKVRNPETKKIEPNFIQCKKCYYGK